MFLFFQVFTGVLVPACEHPKEKKIARNGDLSLEPFKNKINNLFIYNSKKIDIW
jgi:hypothetical protein